MDAVLDGPAGGPAPLSDAVPNTFALGLFPSGMDRHFVSVVTLIIPILLSIAAGSPSYGRRPGPPSDKV